MKTKEKIRIKRDESEKKVFIASGSQTGFAWHKIDEEFKGR